MTTPNKVVHFEIPADDTPRATKFYKNTFGWQMNEIPGMGYTLVGTTPVDDKQSPTELGGINGGLGKREGPLMHPVLVVDVASIDKALGTIEKNGGKTVQKRQAVGDMGFVAYFKDTEGNVVGLWETPK